MKLETMNEEILNKAKEIANRVIKRSSEEKRSFSDILQEELEKLKGVNK